MTTAAITNVFAWEALDSRGKPTVGCRVDVASGAHGRAIVPSGASTGGHEAVELRDGGSRYAGQGVLSAVRNANSIIRDSLIGLDASDQESVDEALEALDTDPLLSHIGANAVLGASLAVAVASATHAGLALWEKLNPGPAVIPMPMVNIISGGAHAGGLLDIQDVLVVPTAATSFAQAIEWVDRIRRATAELLDSRGGSSVLVADEGGLSGALGSNAAALQLVTDGIHRAGLEPGRDASLALDLAANQLYREGRYHLSVEGEILTSEEWLATVADWCEQFPIASIEDILAEDDWDGWGAASTAHNPVRQLLGDDLFATNLGRLQRGAGLGVANAVLVKPNQAGTVSRAAAVVKFAHENSYRTVVSARSGDSEDNWLADYAIGWQARQIKVGSTMRSERTAKWNRVLEVEARAGDTSVFAGWPAQ